jgi:hypothetical protein
MDLIGLVGGHEVSLGKVSSDYTFKGYGRFEAADCRTGTHGAFAAELYAQGEDLHIEWAGDHGVVTWQKRK